MNKKKVNIQVDFLSSKNMFNIILPAIQNRIGRTYPTYSFFCYLQTLITQNHVAVPASVDE